MRAIPIDERGEQDHQQEKVLDVRQLEAEDVDVARPDHVGAARAADIVPVDHEGLQHDRERERGDREERAAQPQRQVAGAQPDDAGDDRRDHHQGGDRLGNEPGEQEVLELLVLGRRQIHQAISPGEQLPELRAQLRVMPELVGRHRRVGAEREERRGAEVHVAAVAAEDVPCGRQHDELQHRVAGEEQVVVAVRPGEDEDQRRRRRTRGRRNMRCARPSVPAIRPAAPPASAGAGRRRPPAPTRARRRST